MPTEYLDILNEAGEPTGQSKTKKEIHQAEAWHLRIHLWIVNSRKEVLLQKRHPGKKLCPGGWNASVAGHVNSGESPEEAIVRESKEELGLNVDKQKIKFLFRAPKSNPYKNGLVHRSWNQIYLLSMDLNPAELILEENEVSEVKFFSAKELREELIKNPDKFVPDGEELEKILLEISI